MYVFKIWINVVLLCTFYIFLTSLGVFYVILFIILFFVVIFTYIILFFFYTPIFILTFIRNIFPYFIWCFSVFYKFTHLRMYILHKI